MAKKKKRTVRKKRKLNLGRLLIVVLIPVLLISGAVFYFGYQNALKPVQKKSEQVTYTVQPGTGAKAVAAELHKEGIIGNPDYVYYHIRQKNLTDVKTGTYTLNKNWTPEHIFEVLNDASAAEVDAARVTIIEGDWAKHAAAKIAAETNVSAQELLELWNDESYLRGLMEKYPFLTDGLFKENIRIRLEGYLAPNTYQFYRETDAKTVTEKILDQQLAVYNSFKEDFDASKYSIHDLYTLASIVQYESGKPDDMKMIAGVFYNRLKDNWPLQSSVTVCYAMDNDDGENWLACEANADFDSPYNTYMYPGLPPGPIVNPGPEAIDAVLHPTENDYFFFMADVATGEVYYAKTLEEHNANVAAHTTYH